MSMHLFRATKSFMHPGPFSPTATRIIENASIPGQFSVTSYQSHNIFRTVPTARVPFQHLCGSVMLNLASLPRPLECTTCKTTNHAWCGRKANMSTGLWREPEHDPSGWRAPKR